MTIELLNWLIFSTTSTKIQQNKICHSCCERNRPLVPNEILVFQLFSYLQNNFMHMHVCSNLSDCYWYLNFMLLRNCGFVWYNSCWNCWINEKLFFFILKIWEYSNKLFVNNLVPHFNICNIEIKLLYFHERWFKLLPLTFKFILSEFKRTQRVEMQLVEMHERSCRTIICDSISELRVVRSTYR